jgi:dipeptidyl aminopeptidase/acylaminoacyl peptidase
LPKGSDVAQAGTPDTPVPLVVLVHGGPHNRDVYGFNAQHQWLANRGYAGLSVNMRGSTGFGKTFLNASAGEWGTKLDDDLSDAVVWAIRNKIANPTRIAIMGGSYGGYAVLRGMTRNPGTYACGIDQYGPSDLLTMQGSNTIYGVSALNRNEVGDPSTPEGRARMRDQSPLTHADQLRNPLLVAQGANDPAVKPYQSDRMVAAVKAHGTPVTYLLYPDEGHGFQRAPNNLSFYAVAEQFLAQCLGGRSEPITADSFSGSSVQVLEGADQIEGLQAALAGRT